MCKADGIIKLEFVSHCALSSGSSPSFTNYQTGRYSCAHTFKERKKKVSSLYSI